MRNDICSIPVKEIFEPMDGCPFCRMRNMLEERMAVYTTGAAMMEPDVRVMTNKLGFCSTHFEQMLAVGSRLSISLILESLLEEVNKDLLNISDPLKKQVKLAKERESSCFICENVEKNMIHLIGATLAQWQKDEEFRDLYSKQTHICIKHYSKVLELAPKNIHKKLLPEFIQVSNKLSSEYMETVKKDVTHFCRMFDYRNKGGDFGNSKDAIERATEFLTTRKITGIANAQEKNR